MQESSTSTLCESEVFPMLPETQSTDVSLPTEPNEPGTQVVDVPYPCDVYQNDGSAIIKQDSVEWYLCDSCRDVIKLSNAACYSSQRRA